LPSTIKYLITAGSCTFNFYAYQTLIYEWPGAARIRRSEVLGNIPRARVRAYRLHSSALNPDLLLVVTPPTTRACGPLSSTPCVRKLRHENQEVAHV
jgi:hypothetical protein